MGLLQGNLSLRRFLALGPVPEQGALVEGLSQDCFRPFEDGLEEERLGWCDWRNHMKIPADPDWVFQERFAVFGLRVDTRRVPAAALKAHIDLKIASMMAEKDLAFVGKEARISLQDEVKAELLRKIFPTPKMIEIAWDMKGGVVWTTGASSKMAGALTGLFMKSFGVELQPLVTLFIAGRIRPHIPVEGLMALDPMNIGVEEEGGL